MAQLSGTLNRPSVVAPAVAGLIVAVVVALGILSWGLGPRTGPSDAPRGGAPGQPVRTDRAAILGGIQSAYLAGIAEDWYVAAPVVDPGMIQSEYLLEISRDW